MAKRTFSLFLLLSMLAVAPAWGDPLFSQTPSRLTSITNTWSALQTFSAGLLLGSDDTLAWGDAVGGGTADTWLSRISAGVLQHGLPDNSSPTAHVLTSQGYNNAVATAGPLFTIKGSNGGLTSGTGGELRLQGGLSGAAAGTGGAITFYTAPLAAGTTPALALTIGADKAATFTGVVSVASGISFPTSSGSPAITSNAEMYLKSFNTYSWYIGSGGYLGAVTDGSVDIGLSNDRRPRTGYFTTSHVLAGSNGQSYIIGRFTQLVTVGSGLTTKATTIQIPADAIVDAVSVRVKTQPGGTSTVVVTSTTSGDQFQKGASISTAAGTTDPGTKGSPRNYNGVAAQTVTLTFDTSTTDALGEIRVDLVYRTMTPATS